MAVGEGAGKELYAEAGEEGRHKAGEGKPVRDGRRPKIDGENPGRGAGFQEAGPGRQKKQGD